ncbi:hypothetical protein Acsp01_46420 [Actinoplanes sp. NBRC 101535]|nr:hypothetical protein Acsp01_46420 [Actinoplanes sp. NBRC 101535]
MMPTDSVAHKPLSNHFRADTAPTQCETHNTGGIRTATTQACPGARATASRRTPVAEGATGVLVARTPSGL